MNDKEKMLLGKLYKPSAPEMRKDFLEARYKCNQYNATMPEDREQRKSILHSLLGKCNNNMYIEPPFYCDYGYQIEIGDRFYANCGCIILDGGGVTIGNNVLLGPRTSIYSVGHPIDAEVRNMSLDYGRAVKIGNDVWLGGDVVVNPGVVIGNNVVIGSGSVVTKDIPDNVVAAGNPCRVLRSITDEDKKYWLQVLQSELEKD